MAEPRQPAAPPPPQPPGETTAERQYEPRDWATRDLRDADATQTTTPARGRHTVADRDEHFFDTDERIAMGEEEVVEARRARVSWLSVLGLTLGVVGILAALTGELAPVAVAAGLIGLLLAIAGLIATGRRHVASRPLAIVASLACLGALALAAMAYSGQFDWLNRNDQVGWLRDWLNTRIPGMDRW